METLRRFEGTSLDELLAYVHRECGESAQIVEANRVRRGGVGGFFAKEGFEVVVAAPATTGRSEHPAPAVPGVRPAPAAPVGMTPEDALAQVIPSLGPGPSPGLGPAPSAGPTPAGPTPAGPTPAGPTPVRQQPVDATTGTRPWMRSNGAGTANGRAAAAARALDDQDGDELIGDVATTLDGVRSVAAGAVDREAELEQAISRDALATMRADRTALVPPHLRTPVAPIRAAATTGDPLLGLVDEINGADQRQPISFAAALEQAMAEPAIPPGGAPGDTSTMSLDDLLDLELSDAAVPSDLTDHAEPSMDPHALLDELVAKYGGEPADEPADEPAAERDGEPRSAPGDPVTMLAEDFIRQADARYRQGAPTTPVDAHAAAMAERLIARAGSADADHLIPPVPPFPLEPTIDPTIGAAADAAFEPLATVVPTGAATGAPAPAPAPAPPVAPATEPAPAPPSVVELMARYEQAPTAPALPAGPGLVLVIGDAEVAHTAAARLAGAGGQVALASQEPPTSIPSWSVVRTTDDVLDRVERTQRQHERLVLAVELGTTPAGLLWAKRLIDRLPAQQVRMAVSTAASFADTRAAIELLGHIDAIDVLRTTASMTAPIDVEQVLGLGTPIATVDGHPTSPALWAALTLEGAATDG